MALKPILRRDTTVSKLLSVVCALALTIVCGTATADDKKTPSKGKAFTMKVTVKGMT